MTWSYAYDVTMSLHLSRLIHTCAFCYRGKEPSVNNELRPSGILIVKLQGMEVLGVDLSPSVSVKDRSAVLPLSF
jgi:hypothetical protein